VSPPKWRRHPFGKLRAGLAGCPEGVFALGSAGHDARRTAAGTAALQSPRAELGHYHQLRPFLLDPFSLDRNVRSERIMGVPQQMPHV